MELERRGFWKVVNEDGGTGGRARLSNVQVAGKTGTAQATDHGRKDTISWFVCWAPFEHPKYTIAVMVQGGEHGGSVAAPIATRILERTLAMDEGKFDAQVAWLTPAHKDNPFQMVKEISFQDSGSKATSADEETLNAQNGDAQMAVAGANPDVEPEADAQGQVVRRGAIPRAQPAGASQSRRPNFFERLFENVHRRQPPIRRPRAGPVHECNCRSHEQ